MSIDWSKYEGSGAVAFEKPGDSIIGVVKGIREELGQGGSNIPVVTLTGADGEEHEVWCGAVQLQRTMARERPAVGDKIKVTLAELRPVGKPSPMKVFEVKVKRAEQAAPATATAAPAPATAAAAAVTEEFDAVEVPAEAYGEEPF